jgi:hypothetical protein
MATKLERPTAADVRAARDRGGDTQAVAAAKVRSSKSAWVKWESEDRAEHRQMPPGLFELYCIKTCQPVPDWLDG